jgi:hypothetical protein
MVVKAGGRSGVCAMKFILTLAALPAATMAVGANAQTYINTNGVAGIQTRIANLEARLNAGAQMGAFSRREYESLSDRLGELRDMEQEFSYNGLSHSELRKLQSEVRSLRDQMRSAGGRGWANRYGWTDRDLEGYNAYGSGYGNATVRYDPYGRQNGVVYDQYGRVIQNNGVAYDQYGRPVVTNGYYGQGGPYEPVYTPRNSNGGIGGVLGSVLGGAMGRGGGMGGVLGSILGGRSLGVGDVITSAIGSVLRGGSSYGTQYRDNNSTYFRSDGERVYEIDARTNQVVRIHPLR